MPSQQLPIYLYLYYLISRNHPPFIRKLCWAMNSPKRKYQSLDLDSQGGISGESEKSEKAGKGVYVLIRVVDRTLHNYTRFIFISYFYLIACHTQPTNQIQSSPVKHPFVSLHVIVAVVNVKFQIACRKGESGEEDEWIEGERISISIYTWLIRNHNLCNKYL